MARRSYRSGDKKMNPQLASQVAGLRGTMTDAIERQPLPKRFDAVEHPDRPAMIMTDLQTGRQVTIGLCDYLGARKVLAAFFPDEP